MSSTKKKSPTKPAKKIAEETTPFQELQKYYGLKTTYQVNARIIFNFMVYISRLIENTSNYKTNTEAFVKHYSSQMKVVEFEENIRISLRKLSEGTDKK